ncbi:MAG: LptF/LptG family permease [Candidatus Sericytochromatia bacterium]|nr:LptF/LptG family permease [Candidatus Sericytochromatia bacterium]
MKWRPFARQATPAGAAAATVKPGRQTTSWLWSPGYRFGLKLIDRYITKELLQPFAIALLAGIVIKLTVVISFFVEMIVRNHAPVGKVVQMMGYTTPATIVEVLPMGYMFATLLVIGRLGKDSELTAMRAAGTSFRRLIFPILILALPVCLASWEISENLVPWANAQTKKLQQEIEMMAPDGGVATNKYFRGAGTVFVHLGQLNRLGHTMNDIMLYDTATKGPKKVVTARSGSWTGTKWNLNEGTIQWYDGDGFVKEESVFSTLELDVLFRIEDRLEDRREPKEMSAGELAAKIAERKHGGLDTRSFDVEYNFKLAQPLAPFFAAFIAAPIGMRFSRNGNYAGVAVSIFVIFVYYVSESIGRSLGSNGLVPPYIASWLYNIFFFVGGTFLLWDVDRR